MLSLAIDRFRLNITWISLVVFDTESVHSQGTQVPSGYLKWFDLKKGYGYIQPDNTQTDVKFHLCEVNSAGLAPLVERERLDYDLQPGYGTTIAVNLRAPYRKRHKRV